MNVFISWSGERSRLLARALADLLPDAILDLKTWMSEHDIQAGARWAHELQQQLESSNFGVLCLTPENMRTPWLLFEAGSLAKSISESKVVPYRLNLDAASVPLPLAQFQGVDANELGTRKLLNSLNLARKEPVAAERLERVFQRWWPDLNARITAIPLPDEPPARISERPANVFWLGHDLARAIRFAMFETGRRDDLERELRQALHHLDEIGLPALDMRDLLMKAIKTHRRGGNLSDSDRSEFVKNLAMVKNEVGSKIADLQPGFSGYPSIKEVERLDREIDDVSFSGHADGPPTAP